MSADPCNICLESIKGVRNKPIQCPKCQQQSCSKCIQMFMLNEINEPHCPNCRYGWTRRFLHENLSRSFLVGPWAAHRRSILWERDQAYMPEAQIHVERIKQSEQLVKDQEPLRERRRILAAELSVIDDMINQLNRNIYLLSSGQPIEEGAQSAQEEARKFVRKCMKSNCPGFLSTAWKCGLCENYTCKECLVIKGPDRDADHTCAEADLATARLIAKDTKPCPKCGEGIYRSEGCSHMFCTSCKTAFNWNTMKIQENGYIDNPHYFAYAQANGIGVRNPGADAPCGGLPNYRIIDALMDWSAATSGIHGRSEPPEYKQAYIVRNCLGHMHGFIANRFNSHNEEGNTNTLRVKYLMNELTKDEVQRQLLNLERKRERHRAIREIIDTFVTVGSDLFRNYEARSLDAIRKVMPSYWQSGQWNSFRTFWLDNKKVAPIIHKIWIAEWKRTAQEFNELREYCNTAFVDVSKFYACVVPQLDEKYNEVSNRFNKEGAIKKRKVEAETQADNTTTIDWDSDSESA